MHRLGLSRRCWRIFEPVGNVPPTLKEIEYYEQLKGSTVAAGQKTTPAIHITVLQYIQTYSIEMATGTQRIRQHLASAK